MDLSHVGLFGHSLGARVLADVVHAHPNWFQAAVALEIGSDTTGKSRKKFDIPFLHGIAASRKSETSSPITFELGKNGYLVTFSPNEQDHDYSYHSNFSDLSTLQYLPAFQTLGTSLKQKANEEFDIKIKTHDLTEKERNSFKRATYVLIKKEDKWTLIYVKDKKYRMCEASTVLGLDTALAALSDQDLEHLSKSEIDPIEKIIASFQRQIGQSFGTGNGWEITNSINTYLVQFFNTFLKGKENLAFKNHTALSKNTYMKCGPGQA